MTNNVYTGRLKWFNRERGFGFILMGDDGPDIFIHEDAYKRSNLKPYDVLEDDLLRFTVAPRKYLAHGEWIDGLQVREIISINGKEVSK